MLIVWMGANTFQINYTNIKGCNEKQFSYIMQISACQIMQFLPATPPLNLPVIYSTNKISRLKAPPNLTAI